MANDQTNRKYPDTVLNLDGHRITIPACLDPVRQVLLGDLEEVEELNPTEIVSGTDGDAEMAAAGAATVPGGPAGGQTHGIGEQRSQTHPGPGNRASGGDGRVDGGSVEGSEVEAAPDGVMVSATAVKGSGAAADEGGDLQRLLNEHSIVRVGTRVMVAFWKHERMPGGERHPVMQFMTLEAFKQFHADKYVTDMDKTTGQPIRVPVAQSFLVQAQRYDGITYAPGEGRVVDGELNMWRGFGVKPKAGNWSLTRAHILEVLAGGNQDQADYITKWLAWAFQNPGRQAETVLVLRGGKGIGKGMFGRAICRIFGSHGLQISSPEHLVGKHNKHLQHCSFLFADEAYWAGDKKSEGALKRIITEPTLCIEPKGIDMFAVKNCLHIIIAGNQDWIVPASHDERRFAVMDVSDARIGDAAYFEKLNAEIERGGLAAMLNDLLAMNLRGWHPRKDVPQTKALQRQKALTISGVDALIEHLCHEGRLPNARPNTPNKTETDGAEHGLGLIHYARYNVKGMRYDNVRVIKTALREWGCKDCKIGFRRGLAFPPLADLRAAFERKYGPQEWSNAEVEDWEVPRDDDC